MDQIVVEKPEKESKITKQDMDYGFQKAAQDGYQKHKKYSNETLESNGDFINREEKSEKRVKIDIEDINKEKMRYMSGTRQTVNEEQYSKLTASERQKLAGKAEPYIIKKGFNGRGNVPYADSNAIAGKRRTKPGGLIF